MLPLLLLLLLLLLLPPVRCSRPCLHTHTAHGSQQDFMLQDNCILVDSSDVITGSANKQDSHRFLPAQPQGLLHRAFSVFLFDSSGKLLLQQRAKDKITFPGE
jgi:isopentenyl-diphosphate delta-isomerase